MMKAVRSTLHSRKRNAKDVMTRQKAVIMRLPMEAVTKLMAGFTAAQDEVLAPSQP
ncbi:MAG: hypothetical protein P4L96_11230 [Rhodoferax sp.]|nr:hypothetical protein [Rhodoferax sp.]